MTLIRIQGGFPFEAERRDLSGDLSYPAKLYQRILERGESDDDQTSDYEMISALAQMDNDDRWVALRMLPDDQCERVADLIPIWQALAAASDDEIEQLYDEMNE